MYKIFIYIYLSRGADGDGDIFQLPFAITGFLEMDSYRDGHGSIEASGRNMLLAGL